MSRIKITCDNGHVINVRPEHAGKRAKCPACETIVEVPSLEDTARGSAPASQTPPAPKHEAPKGQQFGRFLLKRLLGRGSFGSVYLADDPQLNREVALKTPRGDSATGKEELERFIREARSAAQLRHPNIVPVYDAGRIGSRHYIATAYIPPGRTLQSLLVEDATLGFDQKLDVIVQIAEALHHAHTRGIVHRDVKPDNILLDEQGVPYVADFGLARRDEGEASHTQRGLIMGTPAYMSPEQASGRIQDVDARSDQWSLGVVMYELLTGERPFEGENAVQLRYAVQKQPPKPIAAEALIPADIQTICLKCLCRAPQERFASCQDLAKDIKAWKTSRPITARKVSTLERTRLWWRRNAAVANMGAIVLSMLFAAVVAFGLFTLTMQTQNQRLQIALSNSRDAAEKARIATSEAADNRAKLAEEEAKVADAKKQHQELVEQLAIVRKQRKSANERRTRLEEEQSRRKPEIDTKNRQAAQIELQADEAEAKLATLKGVFVEGVERREKIVLKSTERVSFDLPKGKPGRYTVKLEWTEPNTQLAVSAESLPEMTLAASYGKSPQFIDFQIDAAKLRTHPNWKITVINHDVSAVNGTLTINGPK